MPFVADDLSAWLVGVLADAGRKRFTTWVLGTDQERALRGAAAAAILHVAAEVNPEGGERAENLARVIDQVFSEPVPSSSGSGRTLLEDLLAGVSRQIAVLDDAESTGAGVASSDLLGVPGTALADLLATQLISEILRRGMGGGPLAPLADQLNHNLTQMQGRQIEDELVRLAGLISGLRPTRSDDGRLSVTLSAYASGNPAGGFRYEVHEDGGRLLIGPRDPHLDALRQGGKLTPKDFWHSLWEWTFEWPALDVKVVNNTDQTVYFDSALFQVAESHIDLRPVPVIEAVAYLPYGAYTPLENSGWGPMEDCVFNFHLEFPDDPAPLTGEFSWPLDGDGKSRDEQPIIDALAEAGVKVKRQQGRGWGPRWQFASIGPFVEYEVIASGFLDYVQTELDGSRSRQHIPVTMRFSLAEPGMGAPVPPSWTYDVQFHPEGSDYHVVAPVSQAVAPGETDRFLFRLGADKASQHRFTMTLRYNGIDSIECVPVTLELFVPAEYERFKDMTPPDEHEERLGG